MNHDSTPRHNAYAQIHKGLRAMMAEVLTTVGRADWHDAADAGRATAALQELLGFCESHLQHENDFIHAAMEARRPGSTGKVMEDHREHVAAIAGLRYLLEAVDSSHGAARDAAAARLYRSLAAFVAENYEHMEYEETQNNAVLWSAYTDEELLDLHHRLVASLSPAESLQSLRWMLPNVSHAERVMMLDGMRQSAPTPVFHAVIGMLQPLLPRSDWQKLEAALSLPAVMAAAA